MPRDLFNAVSDITPKEQSSGQPPNPLPLVASPESQTPTPAIDDTDEDFEELTRSGSDLTPVANIIEGDDDYNEFTIHPDDSASLQQLRDARAKASRRDELHPYVQTLSLRDLDSCIALENAVFSGKEIESKDTFAYRLTACPELCLGVFSTVSSSAPSDSTSISTFASAFPPDSSNPARKAALIGMIVATKSTGSVASDEAMRTPTDWQTQPQSKSETSGHQENGRTITLWSLGVLPTHQHRGLGKTLLRAYQQRMSTSGVADRIALIAREGLVGMYEAMGFQNKGKSAVSFAGGGWWDLVYEFSDNGLPPLP